MRLFLGLDLPKEIKQKIHDYLLPLQLSVKGWENPHDYHQTLLFIGEVSAEETELIKQRLDDFSFSSFEITLSEFQFFNRRVMFLGVKESKELLELKKRVNETFSEWLRPETKPFLPHITVKRWQRYEFDHLKTGLGKHLFKPLSFRVLNFSLFKSEKNSSNEKYHVLKSINFN